MATNVTGVRVENCEISGHGYALDSSRLSPKLVNKCTIIVKLILRPWSRQHGVVMNGTESGVDSSRVYSVGCSGVRVSGRVEVVFDWFYEVL